jgi:hypothetical protein
MPEQLEEKSMKVKILTSGLHLHTFKTDEATDTLLEKGMELEVPEIIGKNLIKNGDAVKIKD